MASRSRLLSLAGSAGFLAASYLYGSIPFVYALARARGVDLWKTGSRSLVPSNLWQQAGPAVGTAGWLLDASKGALPVAAGNLAGVSPLVRSLGATAGVAGQCWPVFLGFDGGRGVSAILAASAALAPWETAVSLVPMIGGCSLRFVPNLRSSEGLLLRDRLLLKGEPSRAVPLAVGASLLGIPLLAAVRRSEERYPEVVVGTTLNAVLLLVRRATASPERLSVTTEPLTLLANRLLYDRDSVR